MDTDKMPGRLFVDGKDVFVEYGVWVTEGGWNGLLSMPPLKSVETNDWHEEDGVEVDLSAPVLDTHTASVSFACDAYWGKHADFIAALSDGAYHDFDARYCGRRFKLRLVSESELTAIHGLARFSLSLADDFPLYGYEYSQPEGSGVHPDGYSIDRKGLEYYGVRVLQGSLASVMKAPAAKENLSRDVKTKPGVDYDSANVTFKSKDIVLTCLMTAGNTEELWSRWNALLHDLVLPGARQLLVEHIGHTFGCMYKSGVVDHFYPDAGKSWLWFTLTLTAIENIRIKNS